MGNDPSNRVGEAKPDLLLLFLLEHTENTVNRLTGVDGVKCADYQVACFRSTQTDFDRFPVTHFAHQNHLGRLAESSAQAGSERVEIRAHFALIESGFLLRMDELHRVFECDNVNRLALVDLVQKPGQGG